jgi:hypothetical protein
MKTLQKLSKKEKFFESDFFVFDTETTPFKLNEPVKFIFGVVYGYNYINIIYSIDDFKKEFKKPMYKKKKVFAHNADFDLNVLYGNVYELDPSAIFNGSRFIAATNGNCMFADSLNIFPTSVKEIGKMIGKDKQELSKNFWEKSDVTLKDIDYCIRDCEIIFDALIGIFNKVGNIKITAAGLSMEFFRRYYLKQPIDYIDELSKGFFKSYYGGRCEAFYIGKCEGYVYDANSMYVYSMANCKFPNPKFLKNKKYCDLNLFLSKYLYNYEGTANILLNHLDSGIGYLPYRKDGKLMFPIGVFEGWYNFNEIRFALENKAIEIVRVNEMIFAPSMDSPFIEYANETFRLRFASQSQFDSYLYKLFGNSLYGKFAQKINTEQMYLKDMKGQYFIIEEMRSKKRLIKIELFNEHRADCILILKSDKTNYTYTTIPLFSSYITSFARIHLLKFMLKHKEYKPMYCDTDSCFFGIDPMLENSKKLGEFKKENKIITSIDGLKNYTYICDNTINTKIKGIPKFTLDDNNKKIPVIKDNNEVYNYRNLVKTKESLRRGIPATTQINRTKKLLSQYDKRIVLPNGETTPIIII